MLETEIKKLTAALEANTAAVLGGATPKTVAAAATATAAPAPAVPLGAPPPVMPNMGVPAGMPPPAAMPTVMPGAPASAAAPQMTLEQAQVELTTIAQQLGDPQRIQAVMITYGSPQLNQIPAENLFSLVQACKALLTT